MSINPATPASAVFECMEDIDLVLVMSVNPGFGGQKFIPGSIAKIEALREAIDATGREIDLEVDGGIDPVTAKVAIKAGADVLVAGSATFKEAADIDMLRISEDFAAVNERGERHTDRENSAAAKSKTQSNRAGRKMPRLSQNGIREKLRTGVYWIARLWFRGVFTDAPYADGARKH